MEAPKLSFPALQSPQRVASSGNVRAKVVLKPGRSLMDWIKLGASGKDLTGVGGIRRSVTWDELTKHNTEQDCWMSLRGKVYNITPYLEYHPGGIPEIMKGAGKDGTALFDGIHKWVNADSMLEKCFIGPLDTSTISMPPPRPGSNRSLKKSAGSLRATPNSLSVPLGSAGSLTKGTEDTNLPRYDWYQNAKIVTITIYTKNKKLYIEDVLIELKDNKDFNTIIILGEQSYQIHLDLDDRVTDQKVRISENVGKIDLLLTKEKEGVDWKTLGKPLDGNGSLKHHKNRESRFWDCSLESVQNVTHNTKLYCFELPSGVQMRIPVGHHVHVKRVIQGMEITRSYTAVLPSLEADPVEREYDGRRFYLMIKNYPDGVVTPSLEKLNQGDVLSISDHTGNFKEDKLQNVKDVCMIAAGTGFTPMVRLIRRLVVERSPPAINTKLLFANREEKDIIWKKELDELAERHCQNFQVFYTVTKPSPEWEGYEGRISTEMLLEVLPPPPSEPRDMLIFVCGPDPFTHGMVKTLKELSYKSQMIHAFLA